jgi:hypothetical protein
MDRVYGYAFRVFLIALISTFVLFMAFVLTASSVRADDGADDMWTFGNYGTSELLKMPQAHVIRFEEGHVVMPIARLVPYTITKDGCVCFVSLKVMGEGEAEIERYNPYSHQHVINQVRNDVWEQLYGNKELPEQPKWEYRYELNEIGFVNNI